MQALGTGDNAERTRAIPLDVIEVEWLDEWVDSCGKTQAVAAMIFSGFILSTVFFGAALYAWKDMSHLTPDGNVFALTFICTTSTIGFTILLISMLGASIMSQREIRPLRIQL